MSIVTSGGTRKRTGTMLVPTPVATKRCRRSFDHVAGGEALPESRWHGGVELRGRVLEDADTDLLECIPHAAISSTGVCA